MSQKQQQQGDSSVISTNTVPDGAVKRSIAIRLIRHAESRNNQVYYDARRIFKGGTPDFDVVGWNEYVNKLRSADPGLSDLGTLQANKLSKDHLAPHLLNQASHPVTFIISPMKRTIETIIPTLLQLEENQKSCRIIVHGFYFESEGCHLCNIPQQGMNTCEISQLLAACGVTSVPTFVGFNEDDPTRGWYWYGMGREEREESEARAAKFYLWLCEFLDAQLVGDNTSSDDDDIFDAGVAHPEDNHVHDHDKFSLRLRKRRTAILVGHGDFMSLLLKRIMGGFGHAVEAKGVTHRSAFVHTNTGITELEYFGNGRYLFLCTNHTPHLDDDITLKTGGSLKDGWSFLVPDDSHFLEDEVRVAFADELDDHVREQTQALKDLYLKKSQSNIHHSNIVEQQVVKRKSALRSMILSRRDSSFLDSSAITTSNGRISRSMLTFEKLDDGALLDNEGESQEEITFVVKRGHKVVGCASLNVDTLTLADIVVRESSRRRGVGTALIEAVKDNLKQAGVHHDDCLFATPVSDESKAFFEKLGFEPVTNADEDSGCLSRMKCKL